MKIKLIIENNFTFISPKQVVEMFEQKLKISLAVSWESWVRDFYTKRTMPKTRSMSLYRKGGLVPTGWIDRLKKFFIDRDFEIEIEDTRVQPERADIPALPDIFEQLRPYQMDAFREAHKHQRGILKLPTGCHAKGSEILMADGSIKLAERVEVGDVLVGPDSSIRTVQELFQGEADLFKIVPIKGDSFTVTGNHILSLVGNGDSYKDNFTEISVIDYMLKTKNFKHLHKLYRAGTDFTKESADFPVSPYFLGVLLGDGCLSHATTIETPDPEIVEEIYDQAAFFGLRVRITKKEGSKSSCYSIVGIRGKPNALRDLLRTLGLFGKRSGEKFIPFAYKTASRENRLQLLAGLLDTDGYYSRGGFDYITKSEQLSNDVVFLSRSLGFAAYKHSCVKGCGESFKGTYYRMYISGDCSKIPVRVLRRKADIRKQIKNVLRTGFSVEYAGYGEYYGFRVDGDGLYLMGDFTVTHNSGKTLLSQAIVSAAGAKTLIIVPNLELLNQTADSYRKVFGDEIVGTAGEGGYCTYKPITIATVQTLWSRFGTVELSQDFDRIGTLILDECFAPWTEIVLPISGSKRIDHFKVGDRIPNRTGYGIVEKVHRRVIHVNDLCLAVFSDGTELLCTKRHLFLTRTGGYTAIADCDVQTKFSGCGSLYLREIFTYKNTPEKFNQLSIVDDQTILWDLTISNDPSYMLATKSGYGIIVHNSHHVSIANLNTGENTWYKIAQRIPAFWRFGLTATPGKEDEACFNMLSSATYEVIYSITSKELVDLGYLTQPKIIIYKVAHGSYGSWPEAKRDGLGGNQQRNELIRDRALEFAVEGKKVLIIVDRVEQHGAVLYEMIGSKYSSFIYGASDSDKRKKARVEFKNGDRPILIGTVFGEGVDFPYMDCVLIAAGGKSDRQTIQRLGRVLRRSAGKIVGVCIDFMDMDKGNKYLYKHSIARLETYKEEGFEVELK